MLHPLTDTPDLALQLADAMPQLVWIANAAGNVTYYNSRVREFYGARQDAAGNWEWEGMVHPDDLGATNAAWAAAIANGAPYESEHRIRLADGHYEWHLSRALPQKDGDGQVHQWFGTATNIHAQKRAQDTLRESEERFRLLTNAIPQIVWTSAADGSTEFINERWSSYTGQSPDDAGDRRLMFHPDDLPRVLALWDKARALGIPAEWEYRLFHQESGSYRWFSAHIQPLKDGRGRVTKWIGAATDIQALKDNAGLLEQQVAERTQELNRLNTALREQTEELRRSNEDLQQFAHVASHDLKEPLRKIRTFGSRLVAEYGSHLPEKGLDFVDKIEASATRMAEMIDGVLHYSLLGSAEQPLVAVSLPEVVQHIRTDLEVLLQQKEGQLVVGALPEVAGVPVLLHQLFYNLVHNSLKFCRPDVAPVVRIAALPAPVQAEGGAYYAIEVADNGIGFAPELADNIFKSFTRLHPQDRYEGTGLGLALCQKIVQRHHGQIRAEGHPGAGAKFTVLLPA